MAQLQFGVIGHKGRMGQALEAAIADAGHALFAGVDAGGSIGPYAAQCDVLIDFSAPDALAANLGAAKVAGKPIVVGTTGLEEPHFVMLAEAARAVPVLQSVIGPTNGIYVEGSTLQFIATFSKSMEVTGLMASNYGMKYSGDLLSDKSRLRSDYSKGSCLGLSTKVTLEQNYPNGKLLFSASKHVLELH